MIVCVSLNGFIILAGIFYFLLYCYEPFRGRRNIILSLIMQNYLFVGFIPVVYFSLFSDKLLGTINAYFTLVIGLLICRAGGKYQFRIFDHLSKRSTEINIVTVGAMFIGLILKKSSDDKYTYVASLIASLACMLEVFHALPFFDSRVESYFF